MRRCTLWPRACSAIWKVRTGRRSSTSRRNVVSDKNKRAQPSSDATQQPASESTMHVRLPDPATLLHNGAWCQLLAQRIPNTSSMEWAMRIGRSVAEQNMPPARFDSGIAMGRSQVGWGTIGDSGYWFASEDIAKWLTDCHQYTVTHDIPLRPQQGERPMKLNALLKRFEREWPELRSAISNGELSQARAPGHGLYWESIVRTLGAERGKLSSAMQPASDPLAAAWATNTTPRNEDED
jgi:hypothetical protein